MSKAWSCSHCVPNHFSSERLHQAANSQGTICLSRNRSQVLPPRDTDRYSSNPTKSVGSLQTATDDSLSLKWDSFIVHFPLQIVPISCSLQHYPVFHVITSFFFFFLPTALYIKGNDVTMLASMAKLKGGRLARELSDSCLQFWGGMGFTSDVLVSRFYR